MYFAQKRNIISVFLTKTSLKTNRESEKIQWKK